MEIFQALYFVKQMNLKTRVQNLIQSVAPVSVIIASKYASEEQMKELTTIPNLIFGENRLQVALEKQQSLSSNTLKWHMIGHLQTNKAPKAVSHFHSIDSIDSLKIAIKINDTAKSQKKIMPALIQINIGSDPNKTGFLPTTFLKEETTLFSLSNLRFDGIMIVTPLEKNLEKVRDHFRSAKKLFDQTKKKHPQIHVLSMGMSNDYQIAIEEGATQIRIGRAIFS